MIVKVIIPETIAPHHIIMADSVEDHAILQIINATVELETGACQPSQQQLNDFDQAINDAILYRGNWDKVHEVFTNFLVTNGMNIPSNGDLKDICQNWMEQSVNGDDFMSKVNSRMINAIKSHQDLTDPQRRIVTKKWSDFFRENCLVGGRGIFVFGG